MFVAISSKSVFRYKFCKSIISSKNNIVTWSLLASVFNSRTLKSRSIRPQIFGGETGLFRYNELRHPTGFYLLQENAVCKSEILLNEMANKTRQRKMVRIFDELSDSLCKVADLAEFIRSGHPNENFSYAAKEASVSISNLVEKLNTNRNLYNYLKNVVEHGDVCATDSIDEYVAKLFLFDFEQCGIHLDTKEREQIVAYNNYILHVGSHFASKTLDASTVLKSQLSDSIYNCFPVDGDKIVVEGLFADSENEFLREAAYKIFLFPDKHREELLSELLTARHKLANLCGFASYAHRAVKGSIAGTPEFVHNFLTLLSNKIKPRAQEDYKKLLKYKQKINHKAESVMPWDVPFLTAMVKRREFDIQASDYSPYFSLGACMDGINDIFSSLYNVTLKVDDVLEGELWQEDVQKLAVCEGNEVLGYIYCDLFERPSKHNQDCHFTIQGGRLGDDGTYQKPIVVLMLNLPNPSWSQPCLLTPSMIDNLFHEMGHAMHSMLARTSYQHVTGTRCSTDLAEVPSILMEYFSSDPRVILRFAKHYKTGEQIPLSLLNKLRNSKKMFSASETQLQIFYAAFDQACHSDNIRECSTTELLAKMQNLYYGLAHVPNTAWHLRFGHLVGYGAKYYSYLISRAVASWIWHKSFKENPFNSKEGMRYRNEILAHGGSKPPKSLVQDFIGTEVTPETLSSALYEDIVCKYPQAII